MSNTHQTTSMKRRSFLGAASGALAGAAISTKARPVLGANDRINIGVIGCGGRSGGLMKDMKEFMDEEKFTFTAACDVWRPNLERRAQWIKDATGNDPFTCSRFEDMLARDDVDAVLIATPDHGHTPIAIAAAEAKKDIFVEKPVSMYMENARKLVDVVRENDVICQVGTQRRSSGAHIAAAKYIQEGKLGQITKIRTQWNYNAPRWNRSYDDVRQEDVDWEAYQINAPEREFDPRRYRCWHLYRDYSIGTVGLLGAHLTDLVHWYMEDPYPISCVAQAGLWVWTEREHDDTLTALFEYPKNFLVSYESRFGNSWQRDEVVFFGTNGLLSNVTVTNEGAVSEEHVGRIGGQYATNPLAGQSGENEISSVTLDPDPRGTDHMKNWVHAMRDHVDPNAPVEAGYQHSVAAIIAHQAADTGKKLYYDAEAREIKESL